MTQPDGEGGQKRKPGERCYDPPRSGLYVCPESVIRLPFLFRAAVSKIVFSFIEDVAGYIKKKLKRR